MISAFQSIIGSFAYSNDISQVCGHMYWQFHPCTNKWPYPYTSALLFYFDYLGKQ